MLLAIDGPPHLVLNLHDPHNPWGHERKAMKWPDAEKLRVVARIARHLAVATLALLVSAELVDAPCAAQLLNLVKFGLL